MQGHAPIGIVVDGVRQGSGFPLSDHLIVTALHVIAGAEDVQVEVAGHADLIDVTRITLFPEIDVAALTVERVVVPALFARATPRDRWRVLAAVDLNDPILTGTISAVDRTWMSQEGVPMHVDQLQVSETLSNYNGYSGSAVYLPAQSDAVAGMLIEQQLANRSAWQSGPPVSANIVYAVPIARIAEVVAEEIHYITRTTEMLPAGMSHHERVMASLRGHRSHLAEANLSFVAPSEAEEWSPTAIWGALCDPTASGSILLTGHGGTGKTRTILEVANVALQNGWDVLHVQGASASSVAHYVNQRVSLEDQPPFLLVLDYLNLYVNGNEADLLAMTELASQNREPAPKFGVLASSRTGWDQKHGSDAGMDRLDRIRLSPPSRHVTEVCSSIALQVCPRACAALGLEAVLAVTGRSRPILVLLLGQIVEEHFVARATLPEALLSDDLARWLEARLLEDEILLPPTTAFPADLPRLLQAAAVLAITPVSRSDMTRTVGRMLGSATTPDSVEFMVGRLLRYGWLLKDEQTIVAAHDVVVDKLLESAVFQLDEESVRQSSIDTLLSSFFDSRDGFRNVLLALERLLDEQDPAGQASEALIDATSKWIDENLLSLQEGLAGGEEDDCLVATILLTTTLWRRTAQYRWQYLVSSVVMVSTSPGGADGLIAACGVVPRGAFPHLGDAIASWISRSPEHENDQLVKAALRRSDSTESSRRFLTDRALDAARDHKDPLNRADLIRAVLRHARVTDPAFGDALIAAEEWIAEFGPSWSGLDLFSTLMSERNTPPALLELAVDASWKWIERHPTSPATQVALRGLLQRPASDGGLSSLERDRLWSRSFAWLSGNPAAQNGDLLLQCMMSSDECSGSRVAEVRAAVFAWLERHGADASASYLISAMLDWPHLSSEDRSSLWALSVEWFDTNRGSRQANYVVQSFIRLAIVETRWTDAAWATTVSWLSKHGQDPTSNYVLQRLLGWPQLGEDRKAIVETLALAWLEENAETLDASYLLGVLLQDPSSSVDPELLEFYLEVWLAAQEHAYDANFLLQITLRSLERGSRLGGLVWSTSLAWLARYGGLQESHYLLQVVLAVAADEDEQKSALDRARSWLDSHGESDAAGFVLRVILEEFDPTKDDGHWVVETSHRWLESNWSSAIARPLLRSFLERQSSISGGSERVLEVGVRMLEASGSELTAGFVIEALLLSPPADARDRSSIWTYAVAWLQRHGEHPDACRPLQAMVRSPFLKDGDPEFVWRSCQHWFAVNWESAEANRLLEVLVESPFTSGARAHEVWRISAEWLTAKSTLVEACFLLQRLVNSNALGQINPGDLWHFIDSWLMANGESPDVFFLLQDLLGWARLPASRRREVWSAVIRCLDGLAGRTEANYLLQSALQFCSKFEPGRDDLWERMDVWLRSNVAASESSHLLGAVTAHSWIRAAHASAILEHISDWMETFGLSPEASYVLQSLIGWPMAGPEADEVWHSAVAWLGANSGSPQSRHVVSDLLRWPHLDEERADLLLRESFILLERFPNSDGSNHLLQAILAWDGLSQARFGEFWPDIDRWLHNRGSSRDASYLLQSLVDSAVVPDRFMDAIWRYSVSWFGSVTDIAPRSYFLQSIVVSPEFSTRFAPEIGALGVSWLDESISARESVHVLLVFLRWSSLPLSLSDAVRALACRYLELHGPSRLGMDIVLALVPKLDASSADAHVVHSHAMQVLRYLNTDRTAMRLIQSLFLMEGAQEQSRWSEVWVAASRWLDSNAQMPESSVVVKAAFDSSGSSAENREAVRGFLEDWLEAHHSEPTACYLLRRAVKSSAGDASFREKIWPWVEQWMRSNDGEKRTGRLAEEVLESSDAPDSVRMLAGRFSMP